MLLTMNAVAVVAAVLLGPVVCEASRILALVPFYARSHHIVMAPLFQELTSRGHNVTVVSAFPRPGSSDIDLSPLLPVTTNKYTIQDINDEMPNLFKTCVFICKINTRVSNKILEHKNIMPLLNEQFDLVITEIFGSDFSNYFANKMNVPVIGFVSSTVLPWAAERTGLPDNPSYIPNYFVDFDVKMNLFERIYNTVTLIYANVAYYYSSELPVRDLSRQVFGDDVPSVAEVNRRTSMVFVNSHFTLSQSRPFPPNVVEVGGIHVNENKSLPQDLKKILDSSSDGVILFSLGSLVKASSLPPHIIRNFLNVFATLPQRVIFKYEDDLSDVPPNVMVRKWLPQPDIVAHPNLVVVVTHGGLASTIEAVHFAKPVVGVPFYGDQFQNIKNIVRRGGGRILDYKNMSQKDISDALNSVLHEPGYRENMRRLSQQFRDRPMSPLQSAVYWTEYVIRHKGAHHLRPASVDLPLYQYLLLDVAAVLLCPLILLAYIVFVFLKSYFVFFKAVEVSSNNAKLRESKKLN